MSKVSNLRTKYIDAIFEEQLLDDDPKNDNKNTNWLESLSLGDLRVRLGRVLEDDDYPELDDPMAEYNEHELEGEVRELPDYNQNIDNFNNDEE